MYIHNRNVEWHQYHDRWRSARSRFVSVSLSRWPVRSGLPIPDIPQLASPLAACCHSLLVVISRHRSDLQLVTQTQSHSCRSFWPGRYWSVYICISNVHSQFRSLRSPKSLYLLFFTDYRLEHDFAHLMNKSKSSQHHLQNV